MSTPFLRQLARTAPRATRQFSILTSTRSAMNNARAQIFESNAWTDSQPGDYRRYGRHIGSAALFFFPSIGLFLGWPLLVEKYFDASRGIKTHLSDYVHA